MPARKRGWTKVSGRPGSRISAATSTPPRVEDLRRDEHGRGGLSRLVVEAGEPRRLEQLASFEDRHRPPEPPGRLREPAGPEGGRAPHPAGPDSLTAEAR